MTIEPTARRHRPFDRTERTRLRRLPLLPWCATACGGALSTWNWRAYRVLALRIRSDLRPMLGGLESDADRPEVSVDAVRRRMGLASRRLPPANPRPPARG